MEDRRILANLLSGNQVDQVSQGLSPYPNPYGAQLTMPTPGVVPGEQPLMPQFNGAPLVPAPQNANTMAQIENIMNSVGPGLRMMRR